MQTHISIISTCLRRLSKWSWFLLMFCLTSSYWCLTQIAVGNLKLLALGPKHWQASGQVLALIVARILAKHFSRGYPKEVFDQRCFCKNHVIGCFCLYPFKFHLVSCSPSKSICSPLFSLGFILYLDINDRSQCGSGHCLSWGLVAWPLVSAVSAPSILPTTFSHKHLNA